MTALMLDVRFKVMEMSFSFDLNLGKWMSAILTAFCMSTSTVSFTG